LGGEGFRAGSSCRPTHCSHLSTASPHTLQTHTCAPCPKTISAFVRCLTSSVSCNTRTHQIINPFPLLSRGHQHYECCGLHEDLEKQGSAWKLRGVFCSKHARALFVPGIKPLIAAIAILLPLALQGPVSPHA